MKQIKYVAEIPGEDGIIMHAGDDVPLLFDSPDAAFYEGQDMNGVNMWNSAFVVRALNVEDVDMDDEDEAERYDDVLLVNTDDEDHYPIWVGQNGAKWVREWYMRILLEILKEEPRWKEIDSYLRFIPAIDPNMRPLEALLQIYKERTNATD